jgi:hypothetical protein
MREGQGGRGSPADSAAAAYGVNHRGVVGKAGSERPLSGFRRALIDFDCALLRLEQKKMIERILKIIMSGGLAILTALIVYANIHDPGANLKYVGHVLSMDTVAPDSAMIDHALPIPLIWRIAFWSIVTGEG